MKYLKDLNSSEFFNKKISRRSFIAYGVISSAAVVTGVNMKNKIQKNVDIPELTFKPYIWAL